MPSVDRWAAVAGIPISPPPSGSIPKKDIPSEDDMGLGNSSNVVYVNMKGKNLDPKFKDRMEELREMLSYTYQLATIHVGMQVKKHRKGGLLPTDDSPESRRILKLYRAKVMEKYFTMGDIYTWMTMTTSSDSHTGISVEKSEFHLKLLEAMLDGIVTPGPIQNKLEAVFRSISNSITDNRSEFYNQSLWCMLQVYTNDPILDDIRATLRNVTYSVSERMHEVVSNKSKYLKIDVDFEFVQNEYSFNEDNWKDMKNEVIRIIKEAGHKNLGHPPDVDV